MERTDSAPSGGGSTIAGAFRRRTNSRHGNKDVGKESGRDPSGFACVEPIKGRRYQVTVLTFCLAGRSQLSNRGAGSGNTGRNGKGGRKGNGAAASTARDSRAHHCRGMARTMWRPLVKSRPNRGHCVFPSLKRCVWIALSISSSVTPLFQTCASWEVE